MKKVKILNDIFTIVITTAIIVLGIFSMWRFFKQPSKIIEDNFTYYLNTDLSIQYAAEQKNKKVVAYYQYLPHTKVKDTDKKIKYKFIMDENGFIRRTQEYDENYQNIIKNYVYFEKTKYWEQYDKKIKYIFYMNNDDSIQFAIGYGEENGKAINYFEYYEAIKYEDNPGKNIYQIYYLDDNANIRYSIEKEQDTGKNLNTFYYKEKTKYDSQNFTHKEKIIKVEEFIEETIEN